MESIQLKPKTDHDFQREFDRFDETKAGVKGIVDSGIVKIPRIFQHPPSSLVGLEPFSGDIHQPQVPVIDLSQLRDGGIPLEISKKVCEACETWGAFQIINHGIPSSTMEEMLQGIRQFNEQPAEEKKKWYSYDASARRVRYHSNMLAKATGHADWKDTLICDYRDGKLDSEELPPVCRKEISKYMEQVKLVKEKLCQVLSTALGLEPNYLSRSECMETMNLACHYYPACPEPELTRGATQHSDPCFATILLQDDMGGLQVFFQDQWVHVQPLQGALIVNMGDMMQLITNDNFKSVKHRVLVGKKGPRVSAPSFLFPSTKNMSRPYGPLQDLVAAGPPENRKAIYKETTANDCLKYYKSRGPSGNTTLDQFKV